MRRAAVALVISKYSPRQKASFVDHHFYTTVSMIRTMEELMGLPPVNVFDAYAPVFAPLFAGTGDQPRFQADDRNLRSGLIYEMNLATAPGAKKSAQLDFSKADAVDPAILNEILWQDATIAKARATPSN